MIYTSILGFLFTGCLDPKINVNVDIERVEDTSASSSQPESEPSSSQPSFEPSNEPSAQPSNEPSAQPSNEPAGDPNGGGGEGGDPNGGGGEGDPNGGGEGDPNGGGGEGDPNGGGEGDPNGGGGEGDPNGGGGEGDPNGGGGGGGGGTTSSFSAEICEEWLSCATNSTDPGTWMSQYPDVEQGCFNNHNNVSGADLITWFECVDASIGDCSSVLTCGEPEF